MGIVRDTTPRLDGIRLSDGGITIAAGEFDGLEAVSHQWWGIENEPSLGGAYIRLMRETAYAGRVCPDDMQVAVVVWTQAAPCLESRSEVGTDGATSLYVAGRLSVLHHVERYFRRHPDIEDWASPIPGEDWGPGNMDRSRDEPIRGVEPLDWTEHIILAVHDPILNAWAVPVTMLSPETQASLARSVTATMVSFFGKPVPATILVELMAPMV